MDRIIRGAAIGGLSATVVAGGFAAGAEAKLIRGTVVHDNRAKHSFVVASHSGRLFYVHATTQPRIGRRVVLRAHRAANGTYRLERVRIVRKSAHKVRIRGVVTAVSSQTGGFTVSSRGVSMVVKPIIRSAVRMASVQPSWPRVGARVLVTGSVNSAGNLVSHKVRDLGSPASYGGRRVQRG